VQAGGEAGPETWRAALGRSGAALRCADICASFIWMGCMVRRVLLQLMSLPPQNGVAGSPNYSVASFDEDETLVSGL
jgi:hypothetical protein